MRILCCTSVLTWNPVHELLLSGKSSYSKITVISFAKKICVNICIHMCLENGRMQTARLIAAISGKKDEELKSVKMVKERTLHPKYTQIMMVSDCE